MKTGNTCTANGVADTADASMEPGHEDREYISRRVPAPKLLRPQWSPVMKTWNTGNMNMNVTNGLLPQWSPVMKTGNTPGVRRASQVRRPASMEPGHEDREYVWP